MRPDEIAEKLGMGERTVRHWLSGRGIPYSRERNPRSRLIDPYRTYLTERWSQGCHKGSQLEKEVRARGYTGSQRGIYRFLETLSVSALPTRLRRPARGSRTGRDKEPVAPVSDTFCITGHLALFPEAS